MFHLKHLFKKSNQKYFNWNKIHFPSFVFVSVEIYFQKCVYRVSKQVLDWFWAKKLNYENGLRSKLRWSRTRIPMKSKKSNLIIKPYHSDENYIKKKLCYFVKNESLFSNPVPILTGPCFRKEKFIFHFFQ